MSRRRFRPAPPKVWHNPEVLGQRRPAGSASSPAPAEVAEPTRREVASPRQAKIVVAEVKNLAGREALRDSMLAKLYVTEGRPAITALTKNFIEEGFEYPEGDQILHLQLLELSDEEQVGRSLLALTEILKKEAPKRPTVLDARLRRIEDCADEPEVRRLAATLRRQAKQGSVNV